MENEWHWVANLPYIMISVFIISAPSGSGKSTLVQWLLHSVPNLTFSVSYTTRAPRPTEKDGIHYHFRSRTEFEGCLERGEFLEYAEVYGNYYGTHRTSIDNAIRDRKDLVLDIDVQGARQLKVAIPEAISIFVLPPSREILEERLRARSQDSEEVIQRRLKAAAEEVRNYAEYDYVLLNREIEESAARLATIVRAERMRLVRMQEDVGPILESFKSK
jgi:guanylate kinase